MEETFYETDTYGRRKEVFYPCKRVTFNNYVIWVSNLFGKNSLTIFNRGQKLEETFYETDTYGTYLEVIEEVFALRTTYSA